MTSFVPGASRVADLGGPLHYLDYGGPKDGPLLLAVHGLGGAAWNWLALAPLLTARCRLIAIDLAGHGLTPASGRSTTVTANRRLLDRFIREVVQEPVVLVGNSMGGLISLLETAKSPELVAATVLVDPALPRPILSRVDPRVALSFAVMAVPGIGEIAFSRRRNRQSAADTINDTMQLCTVDPARVPAAVLAEGVRTVESRSSGDFAAGDVLIAARSLLRMLARREPLKRQFASVDAPVLLLHGDRDRLVSVTVAKAVAQQFPAWRLEIAADIGHVPMLEAPEWTAEMILDWLDHDTELLAES